MQATPNRPIRCRVKRGRRQGSALVGRALWSDWLLRAVGVEVVGPVGKSRKPEDSRRSAKVIPPKTPQELERLEREWRAFWMASSAPTRRSAFRRWLAEGLTPKALRTLHGELCQFRDALVPEQAKPTITVATLPSGHTKVKVIRGKDGTCRVVQTVCGMASGRPTGLGARRRAEPACAAVLRVSRSLCGSRRRQAGRPAKFCSSPSAVSAWQARGLTRSTGRSERRSSVSTAGMGGA